MILTKETWIIHCVALRARGTVRCWPRSASCRRAPFALRAAGNGHARDLLTVSAVCAARCLFFYSGCLLDWSSLEGLWSACLARGFTREPDGATGHEKAGVYWLQLMGRYEWPALLGAAGARRWLFPQSNRRLARWLCISGSARSSPTAIALQDAVVPDRDHLAVLFRLRLAVDRARALARSLGGRRGGRGRAAHIRCSVAAAQFPRRSPTSASRTSMCRRGWTSNQLLGPLRTLVARDPMKSPPARLRHQPRARRVTITPEHHPLAGCSAISRRVRIVRSSPSSRTASSTADFLLVDETLDEEVESSATCAFYFREPIASAGSRRKTHALSAREQISARSSRTSPEFRKTRHELRRRPLYAVSTACCSRSRSRFSAAA